MNDLLSAEPMYLMSSIASGNGTSGSAIGCKSLWMLAWTFKRMQERKMICGRSIEFTIAQNQES